MLRRCSYSGMTVGSFFPELNSVAWAVIAPPKWPTLRGAVKMGRQIRYDTYATESEYFYYKATYHDSNQAYHVVKVKEKDVGDLRDYYSIDSGLGRLSY